MCVCVYVCACARVREWVGGCADGTVTNLVFEYMEYDLYRVLPPETGNEFPPNNVRFLLRQLLEGVFAMHQVRRESDRDRQTDRERRGLCMCAAPYTHGRCRCACGSLIPWRVGVSASRPQRKILHRDIKSM
jgi:serine/threonine protein kinase